MNKPTSRHEDLPHILNPKPLVTGDVSSITHPTHTFQLPPERFKSTEGWNPSRIGALAMYCSDGRWGEAFDEFCHRSLNIPRYDRFAVPGGPAWLTAGQSIGGHKPTSAEAAIEASLSKSAWEQMSFLVEAHELQRVVLITHYGCAFYHERLHREPDECLAVQLEDLKLARAAVKQRFPRITVESYLAMRTGERLSFHVNL